MENRKLKQQLQKQEEKASEENNKLKQQLQEQAGEITRLGHQQEGLIETQKANLLKENRKQGGNVARFELKLEWVYCVPNVDSLLRFPPCDLLCPVHFMWERRSWASELIYFNNFADSSVKKVFRLVLTFKDLDIADDRSGHDFPSGLTWFKLTILLVDQRHNGQNHRTIQLDIGDNDYAGEIDYDSHVKDDKLIFCITDVRKYII